MAGNERSAYASWALAELLLWGIVADEVDGILPNLSPHVHLLADIHCAAHFSGCGPDYLEMEKTT